MAPDKSVYLHGLLVHQRGLDMTTRERPVMNVDDVYLVLHHHYVLDTSIFTDERQRLQLALLLLLQAGSVIRLGNPARGMLLSSHR